MQVTAILEKMFAIIAKCIIILYSLKVEEHQNDSKELLQRLSRISNANSNDTVVEVFQQIHGPWAFVYFQVKTWNLYFIKLIVSIVIVFLM